MQLSADPINNLENLIEKNRTKSLSIYLGVLLSILIVIILLPVIKIDISSQSRGIIRSRTDNIPIAGMVSGKVISVNMSNNRSVKKGDILIKLTQENLETEIKTSSTLFTDVQLMKNDLDAVISGKYSNVKSSTIKHDLTNYLSKREELKNKLSYSSAKYTKYQQLFSKNVISKSEFEEYTFDNTRTKLELLSYDKNQLMLWQTHRQELEDQTKNLIGNIHKINVESKNYTIVAPTSGTIENFIGIQPNSYINASQQIAVLSPDDSLIVETTVSTSDIGLIRQNQSVKFQVDAYNYNQWGLLDGKVLDIDKNLTLDQGNAFFKVRCLLKTSELHLESGYSAKVIKGMTLTARFIITRRSLYQLLFDKMDDWLNPHRSKI